MVGLEDDSSVVAGLQALQNRMTTPPAMIRFHKLMQLEYGMAMCHSQEMRLAGKLRHNESSHCCDAPEPAG
ncbi:hypothetical protein GCM10023190_06590 [Enteractinococcus fodinae]